MCIGVRIAQVLISNRRLWGGGTRLSPEALFEQQQLDAIGESETRPMLLLCYTNHALDQFLLELLARIDTKALADEAAARTATARRGRGALRLGAQREREQQQTLNAGIVRIGGRSKDEELNQYTLRALRDQLRAQRNTPFYLHKGTARLL